MLQLDVEKSQQLRIRDEKAKRQEACNEIYIEKNTFIADKSKKFPRESPRHSK